MAQDVTKAKLEAAAIASVVEGISIDETMAQVGLNWDKFLASSFSPDSLRIAHEYVGHAMREKYGGSTEGSRLFLVKRVLTSGENFSIMDRVIDSVSNDKFGVVRIIGSHPEEFGYQQRYPGMEAYLTRAEGPVVALLDTALVKPSFVFTGQQTGIIYEDADEALFNVFYNHTPEAVQAFYDLQSRHQQRP